MMWRNVNVDSRIFVVLTEYNCIKKLVGFIEINRIIIYFIFETKIKNQTTWINSYKIIIQKKHSYFLKYN